MALDGIYLYSLVQDFKKSILNAKIDKINQPEKDEIILTLRKERKNIKLLISSSPKYPRIHIINDSKQNPLQAPMFTMVLRKYLIGGKITDIEQLDGDRIIKLSIEATDEMGFDSLYTLIVEIMGRHSNITLVRNRDNKIMDCIKHIGADVNSYRILYPGITYAYPPKSERINPFSDFTLDDIKQRISENGLELNNKIFSNVFTGISKGLSTSLYTELVQNKTEDRIIIQDLYDAIDNLKNVKLTDCKYNIYAKNGEYTDFYCTPLCQYDDDYSAISFEDPSSLLNQYYYKKDHQERLKNRSVNLQRLIHTNIDRCNKKAEKLNYTLEECNEKESFRVKGDLLTSFIYNIKKGEEEITLQNFYSENYEDITIKLNPNKTPSENVQYYYKKYNKLKKSEESATLQLEKNNEELEYLHSVLTNINNCDNYVEINDIRNELMETGYIRKKKASKNDKKQKASKPLHFLSSDGIDIYVGKNNIQNDYLSLKFANKNHMWLHTKNIPGSHVIICSTDIPDTTLVEAGTLAAFYSKAQNSTKVPVDYTLVKNLKKPASGKPGMVIYHTNYTLYAEPSDLPSLNLQEA